MKSWFLNTCAYHILYDEMGVSMEYWTAVVILRKSNCFCCELSQLLFLWHSSFTRRNDWQLNWLFRHQYLAATFSKWIKQAYRSKENNWQYLLPMITHELSSKNQNFGKTRKHHWKLDSFSIIKDSSDEIGGEINKCKGLHCIKKCVNIWKIFITGINSF